MMKNLTNKQIVIIAGGSCVCTCSDGSGPVLASYNTDCDRFCGPNVISNCESDMSGWIEIMPVLAIYRINDHEFDPYDDEYNYGGF
jgi:hypothetical protein